MPLNIYSEWMAHFKQKHFCDIESFNLVIGEGVKDLQVIVQYQKSNY